MKKIAFAVCMILLFGCSDKEGKTPAKDNNQWSIVLNETMYSESHPVYKTEKFLFDHDQLVRHSVNQQYLEDEIANEINLTYSDNQVLVTAGETTMTYILNAEGHADECLYRTPYQNRKYVFTYSADGYLTEMTESIDDTPYSITSLSYENGDLVAVSSQLNDIENTIIYEPGTESSKYNLPCLGLLDLYPFTLHVEALYAGLLGKAPRHFTARAYPEGNDEEYTTYSYMFDEEGNPSQINSQTTYPLGNSSRYYPNRRSISISYE